MEFSSPTSSDDNVLRPNDPNQETNPTLPTTANPKNIASPSSPTPSGSTTDMSSEQPTDTDDSQPPTPLPFDTETTEDHAPPDETDDQDDQDDLIDDDVDMDHDHDQDSIGPSSDDEDDDEGNTDFTAYTTGEGPPSPIRLTQEEMKNGVTICLKNNMKVDQYNYGKSKNGKAGNAERAHNETMTLVPSCIEGRKPTVCVAYPPYIGKKRDTNGIATVQEPTKHLYFKVGPKVHEYNCVRNSWLRAGFVRTNSMSKCSAYWGQHCSANMFRNLNKYQKVNHFPGSWNIGNKARLGKIMGRMRRMHGSEDFHIHAQTMCMPMDRRKLTNMLVAQPRGLWILKPSNSSCGRGIRVTSSASLNPKKLHKGTIVQKYLSNPYLIGGRKFDMRIYVVVTSYDPLRAYLCEEGLVRFATGKYSKSLKSLKNRFVHLTNYSVNKNSDEFVKPTSNAAGNGVANVEDASKWTLTQLKQYFRDHNIDDDQVMEDIKDCCIKTLIAAEPHIASMCHQLSLSRTNCYEVFGFDVFLDKNLKPWLIEVNVSPSLSSSSPLDKRIKNKLLCDVFHLLGFQPFNHKEEEAEAERFNTNRLHRGHSRKGGKQRAKSASTLKRRNVLKLNASRLKSLSPDDMEIIAEMEEEYTRKADMERIYPSANPRVNEYYSQFFEAQRYNNTLVNLWIQEHGVDGLIQRQNTKSQKGSTNGRSNNNSKRNGEMGTDPRRPYGQRSQSSARPLRSDNRPSLVERQGLQRNGRQQMAATRLQEYKAMKLRMEGRERRHEHQSDMESTESDRNWDRDWDAAHGHAVDDNDGGVGGVGGVGGDAFDSSAQEEDNEHRKMWEKNNTNGATGLSPKLIQAQKALDSAQSDFVGMFVFLPMGFSIFFFLFVATKCL